MGQRAVVAVEGLPDKSFTGTVTKIAPLAESRNRWMNPDLKEYTTEITLDQTEPGLKPGATANAEILVEYLRDAIAVPVQAVYGYGGDQYVFRTDGGQVQPAKVQLGTSSTEYVQVLDGLASDQQITMVVTDEMKQMLAKSGGKQEKQPGGNDLDSEEVSRLMAGATTQPAGAQDAKAGGVSSYPRSGNGSAERPSGRIPREGGRRPPRAEGIPGGAGPTPRGG
jgi:hypothetical protein